MSPTPPTPRISSGSVATARDGLTGHHDSPGLTVHHDAPVVVHHDASPVRDDRAAPHVPAFAAPADLAALSRSWAARVITPAWLAGVAVATFALSRPGLATGSTTGEALLAARAGGTAVPAGDAGSPLAPLLWALPDLWARATGAYDRWPTAVAAGREFALVSHVLAAMLLWTLCRRFALARPLAAVAVLAWAASPLVIETSRLWTGAALAAPWVLAAFVLATLKRHRLVVFALSWLTLTVATALSPASLVFVPGVLAVMWRQLDADDAVDKAQLERGLQIPAAIGGAVLAAYAVVAGSRGFWPVAAWRSTVADGMSMLVTPSATADALHHVAVTEPVLPLLGLALAVVALRQRSRPLAAQVILTFVVAAVGLSPLDAFNALPLCALLVTSAVAVALQRAWAHKERQTGTAAYAAAAATTRYDRLEVAAQGLVALVGVGVVVATCLWPAPLAAVWAGQGAQVGPATVAGSVPAGKVAPKTGSAAAPSVPSVPSVPSTAPSATAQATARRSAAGGELAGNSSLTLTTASRAQLLSGQVDRRVMTTLVLLTGITPLTVASFEAEPGTDVFRTVTIADAGDVTLTPSSALAKRLAVVLQSQHAPFRPARVTIDGAGLTYTFTGDEPTDLLVDDTMPQPEETP